MVQVLSFSQFLEEESERPLLARSHSQQQNQVFFFLFIFIYLFIWLHWVFVSALSFLELW